MFKNPFSFDGRIRRLEYGLSYIIYMFSMVAVILFAELIGAGSAIGTIVPLFFLPAFWFLLAQGAKRCHDRGNSGIWQIIPFYGLWMLFAPGDIGRNEYGRNPKGIDFDPNDDYFEKESMKPIDDVDDDGIIINHTNRMHNLDQLLSAANVNDSIIEIDNFIGNACNYGDNMNAIAVPQQKFYINQNLEREVNNGGFWQYFLNSSGRYAHETVLSLQEIGAIKTAEVLQKAIDLFPGGKVPEDRDERMQLVYQIDPDKSIWQEVDERFMDYQEDLNDLNIKFVALHRDSF